MPMPHQQQPGIAWRLVTLPFYVVSGMVGVVAGTFRLGARVAGGVLSRSLSLLGLTGQSGSGDHLLEFPPSAAEAADFVAARIEAEEILNDQRLREEQDAALEADQARERERIEELERREREAAEAERKREEEEEALTRATQEAADGRVARLASQQKVVIFGTSNSGVCHAVKTIFTELGVGWAHLELDKDPGGKDMEEALARMVGRSPPVHLVFIGGKLVGTPDQVVQLMLSGKLVALLRDAGALWV